MYNVDPVFAASFKHPKTRATEFFSIKFMDAAFDRASFSGDFYISYEERVHEHKIVEAFENAGAGSVYIQTFDNDDNNESASAALLRVWDTAAKNNPEDRFTKGECNVALRKKTEEKQKRNKEEKELAAEFNGKTKVAQQLSLAEISSKMDVVDDKVAVIQSGVGEVKSGVGEVKVGVGEVKTGVDNVLVKMEEMKEHVNEHSNKRSRTEEKCVKTMQELEAMLEHKTKEVDRIEHKMGDQTKEINAQKALIADLQETNRQLRTGRAEDLRNHAAERISTNEKIGYIEKIAALYSSLNAAQERYVLKMEPIAGVHEASAAVLSAMYEANQKLLDELQKAKDTIAGHGKQMAQMGTQHALAMTAKRTQHASAIAAKNTEKVAAVAAAAASFGAIVAEKDKMIAKYIASLDDKDDTIERITDELDYFMQV